MLLSSFASGLMGNPGRKIRHTIAKYMEEAIKIATTVSQAELQER